MMLIILNKFMSPKSFNSLSRDHGEIRLKERVRIPIGHNFQLPLSGSLLRRRNHDLAWGIPFFQLPLSGSLSLTRLAASSSSSPTFNSLSRDHITQPQQPPLPAGRARGFQLPLSGSPMSFVCRATSKPSATFNSLSRDHFGDFYAKFAAFAIRRTFNSLSRDHALSSSVKRELSDPFNSLSRDHRRLRTCRA